jgi:hypothetical protein
MEINYATTLDNLLMVNYDKLPENLKMLRSKIHMRLDLTCGNPEHKFTKEEVMEMLIWFLDNPVPQSFELSQYIIKVYFKSDINSKQYSV